MVPTCTLSSAAGSLTSLLTPDQLLGSNEHAKEKPPTSGWHRWHGEGWRRSAQAWEEEPQEHVLRTLSRASSPANGIMQGSFLKPQVEQRPRTRAVNTSSPHTGRILRRKRNRQWDAGMKTNLSLHVWAWKFFGFFFPFEFTSPSCLPETSNHRKFFFL